MPLTQSRGCRILWHIGKCCKPRLKAFISWQLTADIPPQMLHFASHKSFNETSACHHLSYYSFQTMWRGHLPSSSSESQARFQLTFSHSKGLFSKSPIFPPAVMQICHSVADPDEARAPGDRLRGWI